MPKQSKKERRRIRQKQKRKQTIKLRNESPYDRLARSGRVAACKVNGDCREQGLYSMYMLLASPGHLPTLVGFLVDKWCMGLKDAWGVVSTPHEHWRELIGKAESKLGMIDFDPDEARTLITAGIRQAHEMGFRLPPNYHKWTHALGIGDEWKSADLTDFGKDGKCMFVGPLDHLAEHLLDGDAERFLARPDVGFDIIRPAEYGPYEDEAFDAFDDEDYDDSFDDEEISEEEMELLKQAGEAASKGAHDAIRSQCFAAGEAPDPRLAEAIELILAITAERYDPDLPPEDQPAPSTEEVLSMVDPQDRDGIAEALDQARRMMAAFATSEGFADAAGLIVDEEDDEDEEDEDW